jgi:hypothetical protein
MKSPILALLGLCLAALVPLRAADVSNGTFQVTFNNHAAGTSYAGHVDGEWNWEAILARSNANRTTVVQHSGRRALRANFTAGSLTGPMWRMRIPNQLVYYCEYKVFFPTNWSQGKGGKLPGLAGGVNANPSTGGEPVTGYNGWSARMMWGANKKLRQYVYHVDMPNTYGDSRDWRINNADVIPAGGQWHTIRHKVTMNTGSNYNGRIEGWFNGTKALDWQGLRFRLTDTFAINCFLFHNFYGGDSTFAPTSNTEIYFDDVKIWSDNPPPVDVFWGTYRFQNANSLKVAEVTSASTSAGAIVQQYSWSGADHQRWELVQVSGDIYRITAKNSGLVMEVLNGSTSSGAAVVQASWSGSDKQKWRVEPLGGGLYKITNKKSGKVLEVSGGSTSNGADLVQGNYSGANKQKWKLLLP